MEDFVVLAAERERLLRVLTYELAGMLARAIVERDKESE